MLELLIDIQLHFKFELILNTTKAVIVNKIYFSNWRSLIESTDVGHNFKLTLS